MKFYDTLQKFMRSIEIEHDRRIRAASQVREYRIGSSAFTKYEVDQGKMTRQHKSSWTEGLGNRIGHFLSNFTYVAITLGVYIFLSIVTFIVLFWVFSPEYGKGFLIAYGVTTGGDPLGFADELDGHKLVWAWLLILHLLSWLVVPVLAATAVDAAYRVVEQRRTRATKELNNQIGEVGKEIGLSDEDIRKVFDIVEKHQARKP